MAWHLRTNLYNYLEMIYKLENSIFGAGTSKVMFKERLSKPLTKVQWIIADRIVMIGMFVATILGAILMD